MKNKVVNKYFRDFVLVYCNYRYISIVVFVCKVLVLDSQVRLLQIIIVKLEYNYILEFIVKNVI